MSRPEAMMLIATSPMRGGHVPTQCWRVVEMLSEWRSITSLPSPRSCGERRSADDAADGVGGGGRRVPRDPFLVWVPGGPPAAGARAVGEHQQALLLGTSFFDVLRDDILVGGVPVSDLFELAALHLPDLDKTTTFMILRRDLQRRHQPAEGEVVDLLEPLLHVLASDLAIRLGLDGVANGLDVERGSQHAPVVVHGGGHLLGRLLALLLVHLADLVEHGVVGAHARELHRVVALGRRKATAGFDVDLGGAPDERDDLAERIADPLELLDRYAGGPTEQVSDDEVGAEALGDVEHLGAHLDTGRRDREGLELEALLGSQVLDHLDRLAAGRVVIEEVRDLLALEAATELLLGEVDGRRALRPVGGGDGEDVRVARAVGGGGAAEAGRRPRDAILGQPRRQRIDVRRAIDVDADRALLLVSLVGLNPGGHLVLVVDLDRPELVTVDATLGVHEGDV